MENIPLLKDIVILVAVSVPVILLLSRVGLPTIIGFLITGVLIGPHGLGLVTEMHSVEVLAEIGIVLLLFTIGLEFSVTKLLNIRRAALMGGGMQVFFTLLITFFIARSFGLSGQVSILLGFIVSLSSTAIVLKLLQDRGEISSPQGSLSVAILLFQDIAVVLMVIVVQSLAAGGEVSPLVVAEGLGIALVAIAVIVVLAYFLLPRLFHLVVKLQNREVFILTVVMVCFGMALITSAFGLSLALGAFIAGFIISESEYADQIVADILPFKETFASLFFISIGMLLELSYLYANFPRVIIIVIGILFIKAIVIILVGRIMRQPLRLSIMVGLNLAQVGEFSFILIKMGDSAGLLTGGLYQTMLAVSIITMAATPFLFQLSPGVAFSIARLFGAKGGRRSTHLEGKAEGDAKTKTGMSNHVIIVGYGVNGKNLASVLDKTSIEHLVIDTNVERVREARKDGHTAYFADATHPGVLRRLGVERAKIVVMAVADPINARRVVKTVSDINPAATIVVRTRFVKEVEELYELGASQVIPEEFETSVEIFSRVLHDYRIPPNIIQNQIDLIREGGYAMFRHPHTPRETLTKLTSILEQTIMDTFYVDEGCNITGKTLGELDIRKEAGATVIAAVRKGIATTNPPAEFKIEQGDILVILGSHAQLHAAVELLKFRCPI